MLLDLKKLKYFGKNGFNLPDKLVYAGVIISKHLEIYKNLIKLYYNKNE